MHAWKRAHCLAYNSSKKEVLVWFDHTSWYPNRPHDHVPTILMINPNLMNLMMIIPTSWWYPNRPHDIITSPSLAPNPVCGPWCDLLTLFDLRGRRVLITILMERPQSYWHPTLSAYKVFCSHTPHTHTHTHAHTHTYTHTFTHTNTHTHTHTHTHNTNLQAAATSSQAWSSASCPIYLCAPCNVVERGAAAARFVEHCLKEIVWQ